MSIGGTLAEARQRAGLSVADVSARTRIRQTLIRAIEHDNFGLCGGDFYARGHVRAIARVVGVDSEPLIREYDAGQPEDGPFTMDDLLAGPATRPLSARRAAPVPPDAPVRLSAGNRPGAHEAGPPRRPSRPPRRARHPGALLLVLVLALGVITYGTYRVASAGGAPKFASAAATAPSPPRKPRSHPASPRPRPSPAAHASSAPAAPATPAPRRTTTVTPVSAAAFGPGGTADGDNPQIAAQALSGDPAAPWQSDWYTTAEFGNLKSGTGLLLDLGRTVTATRVTVHLDGTHGANLQIRAGTAAGGLRTVASASDTGSIVRLRLTSPTALRYVLVWFTLLPTDSAGTYRAAVSGVTVTALGAR